MEVKRNGKAGGRQTQRQYVNGFRSVGGKKIRGNVKVRVQ